MEKIQNNIEYVEEKSIKNTLLYIKNLKINTESYEYKILSEETIENMIKFQIAYEGENQLLKYDVSNTISLEEYLKTNKLNKKDVCDIILAIDDILFSIENYLISENSLVLDLKAIRLTKLRNNRIKYKFVSVPNLNLDFSYELSKFLIRILRFVDIEDKEALSLAYGLFVRSSKDNYTMNDLIELVDKVRDKSYNITDDITMEELINYDEELANEISDEIMEENRFDFSSIDANEVQKEADKVGGSKSNIDYGDDCDDENITIDRETNDMLQDSLFNDFNKDDKKIVKFKKNIFGLKKKRALKGHIRVGLLAYAVAPILIILLPLLVFFIKT